MRFGNRARIGLFVSLGILAGFGFVSLPAFLVGPPHPAASPRTSTNSTSTSGNAASTGVNPPSLTRVNTTNTQQSSSSDQPVSIRSLTGLISIVIVPAIGISLVGSLLVARRSRRPPSDPHQVKAEDS